MRRKASFLVASGVYGLLIAVALLYTVDTPRYDLIFIDSKMLFEGFVTTVVVSLLTLICSMVLGFMLFIAERSKSHLVNAFAVVFNELMMGTPLLVMIFLAVYVIGEVIFVQNKLVLGVFALTLYMAPYLANAYKSAVAIVDDDQYVVMDLYHFTLFERYRYIIIPQMIRPLLPSLINNLSSIIKGSALLKIVSVTEISYVLTVVSSKNWAAIEGYYVMWVMYLIITIPLSLTAKYVAKKVTV